MAYLYLVIIGILGGLFGGMGMGGGTLLIPMLTIFMGFLQKTSQGINLIVFIPMCILVLFIHKKNKLLEIKKVLPMVFSGVICSIGGSIIAQNMQNKTLKIAFGIFLIIIAVFNIIEIFFVKKSNINGNKN